MGRPWAQAGAEVEEFLNDYALAEFRVLAQQGAVEPYPACCGATAPFPLHGANLDNLWMIAGAFGPAFQFGLEYMTRNRFLQRLPLYGRGGSHGWRGAIGSNRVQPDPHTRGSSSGRVRAAPLRLLKAYLDRSALSHADPNFIHTSTLRKGH